ncbi:MAG: hypothetical protein HYU39_06715 [Thaumarchaeota archaeon]|nr:hypothetical protein [Nitrososphaerota archaeon]
MAIYRAVHDRIHIWGNPRTVLRTLQEQKEMLGFGVFQWLVQFGSRPHEFTAKNMELFSREVISILKRM